MSRLFIAAPIDEAARAAVEALIAELARTGADVKWSAPENLHLTLKFLGETPHERIPELTRTLEAAAQSAPAFAATLSGLGAFPSLRRPQTLWIGVSAGARNLAALAAKLGAKDFVAHLTIGRVRGPRNEKNLKDALKRGRFERELKIDRIILYESRPSPHGSRYISLFEVPFPA